MDFAERLNAHIRIAILLSLLEAPAEDRLRLAVLCILSRIPGRSATASFLEEMLLDYGFEATREQVVAVLSWCDRSGLVALSEDDGVVGALVLDLGRAVAAGKATVPGVAAATTPARLQDQLTAKSLRQPLDDILKHLGWLEDRGLVRLDDLMVLPTVQGLDVASGRAEVDGVKPPSSSTIMRLASNAARDRLRG